MLVVRGGELVVSSHAKEEIKIVKWGKWLKETRSTGRAST